MRILQILQVFVAAMLLACLLGCNQSPSQRYRTASIAYEGAVETAADLANAGLITLEQALLFESARLAAASVLDEAEAALERGDTKAAVGLLDRADRYLEVLIQVMEGAERANGHSGGAADGPGDGASGGSGARSDPFRGRGEPDLDPGGTRADWRLAA